MTVVIMKEESNFHYINQRLDLQRTFIVLELI